MPCYDDGPFGLRREARSLSALILEALSLASRIAGFLVLVIYLPALLGIAAAIAAVSPGPVLVKKAYRRRRSQQQELVYLYEFRTECWRTWQPTDWGAFLRLTELHRLPRLLNVLMGDIAAGERVAPAHQ
ncbi:MAG TPA: sugar transferase [Chthonomonadaceae bacterium]|nr:sugar transferase [Chthonomonadaceae bacterium]